jgi:hypothetical protein
MLMNIAIAAALMVATTAIHAGGMVLAMSVLRAHSSRHRLKHTRVYWVCGIVLLMFIVSLLEVLVWAVAYLALNAIDGFEKALYFSMVTFTTLGYGEIVLDERWRLLAASEAGNGIIMFGWTTAIVIAAVQRIYHSEKP